MLSKEKIIRFFATRCNHLIIPAVFFALFGLSVNLFTAYALKIQVHQERETTIAQVSQIMAMYDCQDPEILTAIMDTFDPVLVAIVVAIESEYQVDAISPAGCRGLMQLSPGKLDDWQNVAKNIQVGSRYLEAQVRRFGSLELAMAAYNAGPESVILHGGVPPFQETQSFIKKAKYFGLVVNKSLFKHKKSS